MDSQKTYYNKIKFFIIWITLISQLFICVTFSYSYFNFRISNYRTLSENQKESYSNAMNSLSSKIDNILYMLDDSEALDFCSRDYIYKSSEEIEKKFTKIKSRLDYSELSRRYFSSYYLISNNVSNFSFANIDGEYTSLDDIKFNYPTFMNFDRVNSFNINYQKIFKFSKETLTDLRLEDYEKESYEKFLNELDGKLVYSTIRKNVLCILVFNENIFRDIFNSAEINHASVELKNSSGELIYSSSAYDDFKSSNIFFEETGLYTLSVKTHMRVVPTDLIFIIFMLILCFGITFLLIRYSDFYAAKIMEPYRILNNFFRLSSGFESFELSDFSASTKKRTAIIKVFFKAYFFIIFIPSIISLSLSTVILNFSTRYSSDNSLNIAHSHLINEFYSNFELFTANNNSETENSSRFNYSVTTDGNYVLTSQPFEAVTYKNLSSFNKTLKSVSPDAKTGTIINFISDLFGEPALGILKKINSEKCVIKVIKSESIGDVLFYEPINFILTDSKNNIVAKSPYVADTEDVISGIKPARKFEFSEYSWTLFTFIDENASNKQINRIIVLNILIITLILLMVSLITWYASANFTNPIEYIISSISKYDINSEQNSKVLPYNNEIEELLSVYNQMLDRLKNMSEEKLSILTEKERLNTLKIQSELNALQHQINPHFLYNTLQTISLNISSYNADEIMRITSSLSDIYRYATSSGDSFFLCDEFENLRNYVYIWSALFPGRFTVAYDIDPNTEIVPSLKLILQPIVENSFIYAFKNKTDNCRIDIKAVCDDEYVTITVKDNGCGIAPDDLKKLMRKIKDNNIETTGKGIGIKNVYQRLKLYYGDHFTFKIDSAAGEGTTVTLKFSLYIEPFE